MGQTETSLLQAYQACPPLNYIGPGSMKIKNGCGNSAPLSDDRFKAETKPRKSSSFPLTCPGRRSPAQAEEKAALRKEKAGRKVPELVGPSSEPLCPRTVASEDTEEDMGEMFGVPFNKEYLDVKSRDEFRMSYLRKLSQQKVLVPVSQRPPKSQSVTIFDWDDTLLCTSYLQQHTQGHTLKPCIRRQLKDIERVSKRLLELATQLGEAYIITNAIHGWVEHSAAKYVPGLLPVLQKVEIISARTRYEGRYPGQVEKWKPAAFMDLQKKYDSHVITNLNALGDSNYEMDATRMMGREFSEVAVKTIKFQENPSPEELLKQLELIVSNFQRIAASAKNMKVSLERRSCTNIP